MEEILQNLRDQGILIDENERAACVFAVSHYWLFRIQPYIDIFLHEQAPFHFHEVLSLYDLDKQMRNLLGELIQMIEINFKTKLVTFTNHIPWDAPQLPQNMFTETGYNEIEDILTEAMRNLMMHANDTKHRTTTDFHDIIKVASFGDMCKIFKTLSFPIKENIVRDYQTIGNRSVHQISSWLGAIRKMRNIWAHHDICIRNPARLSNISLEPGVDWRGSLFNYLKVLFFLCGQIDLEYRNELRRQCIMLIEQWIQTFPFFQRLIGAPDRRRNTLNTL